MERLREQKLQGLQPENVKDKSDDESGDPSLREFLGDNDNKNSSNSNSSTSSNCSTDMNVECAADDVLPSIAHWIAIVYIFLNLFKGEEE